MLCTDLDDGLEDLGESIHDSRGALRFKYELRDGHGCVELHGDGIVLHAGQHDLRCFNHNRLDVAAEMSDAEEDPTHAMGSVTGLAIGWWCHHDDNLAQSCSCTLSRQANAGKKEMVPWHGEECRLFGHGRWEERARQVRALLKQRYLP